MSISKSKQRGVSLVELVVFIVVVGVSVTGVLSAMTKAAIHSGDPLLRKQSLAAAESLLEEVELQDFIDQNDGVTTACPAASAVTAANRTSSYHILSCYNGYATNGIFTMSGVAITDLANYKAAVTIDSATSPLTSSLGTVAAGNSVLISVAVTDPQGGSVQVSGYRTKY